MIGSEVVFTTITRVRLNLFVSRQFYETYFFSELAVKLSCSKEKLMCLLVSNIKLYFLITNTSESCLVGPHKAGNESNSKYSYTALRHILKESHITTETLALLYSFLNNHNTQKLEASHLSTNQQLKKM